MTGLSASPTTVHVVTPSRLHFGLMSFGTSTGPVFGGVGAMIDQPGVELSIEGSEMFRVTGPHAERVRQVAARFLADQELDVRPPCHIEIRRSAPLHVGLGTGTQLAMAVVAGLATYTGLPNRSIAELATSAGRGRRSSIGSHGFCSGGFLYEETRGPSAILAPVEAREDVPPEWRWLLVRPQKEQGLSGAAEQRAFTDLPSVPTDVTASLRAEIRERLLPALRNQDFGGFSESLYRYGIVAGNCFAARQGGPFATPRIRQMVDALRDMGVRGVGQSSWGPTIFGLCPDAVTAEEIRQRLCHAADDNDLLVSIAAPNNEGALVKRGH